MFNDLLGEIQQADLSIANLECPLVEAPSPILKTGPTFGESPECINGIKSAGIKVLALANNHIMDHGSAGLRSTVETCIGAGIDTVGAGENLTVARRMLIKQAGAVRVGILAVAEHEFSIATETAWGAAPLDLVDVVRNIRSERENFDYLVVLVHGGDEFLIPSPRIKDTCRFLVEMGANAVIVQHPHVLGGYEDYQGGHIVYGQGALIMDEAIYRKRKSFHEGFLVKLLIQDNFSSSMEIIPFVQSDPVPGARRMDPETEKKFRVALEEKSRLVQDDAFVQKQWLQFCQENAQGYLSAILGHNRILRKLNVNGWFTRLFYGKSQMLGVRNCICCETHREALETIFNNNLI